MDPKGGSEDPPPVSDQRKTVIDQRKTTWVSKVQEKRVLKKYEIEELVKEDKHMVMVPSAIIEKANPLWDDFVIANFLEEAPHIAKVHVIVNKIWAFGDKTQKLDVFEMDGKTMRIRITSAKVREKVVRRGMWNIAGVPMVVTKWAPEEEDSLKKLLPLWVNLKNVPMSMYSWEGISFITSSVGIPDHLHPETLACTNFEEAKVFVKADLTKELPSRITYNIKGVETTVVFTYPWLPARCTTCRKWGHYATFCSLNKKKKVENQEKSQVKNLNEKEESEQKELEEKAENKDDEVDGEMKDRGSEEGEQMENKKIGEGKTASWETVSQKTSRSPKQGFQQSRVIIATPSRFAALSNSE